MGIYNFISWFFIFIDRDLWEGLILIKKCQAKIKSCLDFLKIFKGSWACALILIKKKGDRKSLLKSKKLNQYLKKWLLDLKKHLYLSKMNNFGLKKTHQNQNAPNTHFFIQHPLTYFKYQDLDLPITFKKSPKTSSLIKYHHNW